MINAKEKKWKEVIKHADEALSVDQNYVKAKYHKGRALIELSDYPNAIEELQSALQVEPENAEVKKELSRAEIALKKYQEKEAKMF